MTKKYSNIVSEILARNQSESSLAHPHIFSGFQEGFIRSISPGTTKRYFQRRFQKFQIIKHSSRDFSRSFSCSRLFKAFLRISSAICKRFQKRIIVFSPVTYSRIPLTGISSGISLKNCSASLPEIPTGTIPRIQLGMCPHILPGMTERICPGNPPRISTKMYVGILLRFL